MFNISVDSIIADLSKKIKQLNDLETDLRSKHEFHLAEANRNDKEANRARDISKRFSDLVR